MVQQLPWYSLESKHPDHGLEASRSGARCWYESPTPIFSSELTPLVALEGIEPDEELFAIPSNVRLTTSSSSIPPNVLDPLKDSGPWPSLIVTILFEYLKGKDSFWYPYFQVLPTAFDTLMFWTDAELAELQASAVLKKIGKASAEESWRGNIIPAMLDHPGLFPAVGSTEEETTKYLIRLAHFAGSLIMAYAFDIDRDEEQRANGDSGSDEDFEEDDEDEPLKGMVPFADMLNADAHRNNVWLQYPACTALTDIPGSSFPGRRLPYHEGHQTHQLWRADLQRLRPTPSI
jgi:SET domain